MCKILLVANHAPRVRASDAAMWRRMARVPFTRVLSPAERDPRLKEVLCDPERGGTAVLAWAVKGCLAWQASGLTSCAAVDRATAAYRDEMDTVQRFIDDCCVIDVKADVTFSALYRHYTIWCEDEGVGAIGKREFAAYLETRGFESVRKTGGTRHRLGIGLRDPQQEVA